MSWNASQLVADGLQRKFTPADEGVDWQHVNTIVHGPGTPPWGTDGGEGDGNSAVFACLMAIATAYTEPPLRLFRFRAGREYPIEGPLAQLIDRPTPNGELSWSDLMFISSWNMHTDGNAYLLKVRAGDATRGNVIQLWPVSPASMWPVTERDRDGVAQEWISFYRMKLGQKRRVDVPVENVIHFRLGVDPEDMRLGLSPLKRLLREIASDVEASKFTAALLKNFAIPGLVVRPAGTTEFIDKDEADRIAEQLGQKFSGDSRGKIAVLSSESEISQFGFSPEQMTLNILHRLPEERIAAVMGVPAIVAGLGAGLDRGTYSNARELREMFTETKLVPLWRQDAARLNVSLKPDFSSDSKVFLRFDLSDVRALQEDEDSKYTRLNLGVSGQRPWILRNEARSEVGFDPIEGWDDEDRDTAPKPIPAALLASQNGQQPAEEEEAQEGAKSRLAVKRRHPNARELVNARRRVRAQAVAQAEDAIQAYFNGLADRVLAAAAEREPDVVGAGNGHMLARKQLSRAEWARIVALIMRQEQPVLEGVIEQAYVSAIGDSWELLNIELGTALQFNVNDPLVQSVLRHAGDNIRDLQQTTLEALRPELIEAYREGEPIEDIARRVRGLVEETYSGRARAIARTEVGNAQNRATSARYRAAGVRHVEVFDNGFDNSHEFCRRVAGAVVTTEWADSYPLTHPNCVRAFAAVFDYTGPVWTEPSP